MFYAIAKDNPRINDALSFDRFCETGYVETRFDGVITGLSEQAWRRQPWKPYVRSCLSNFQLTTPRRRNPPSRCAG